jgi:glycosyltransferase involved in cell wall biosynthesis
MVDLGTPPSSSAAATSIPLFEPYLQFADAVVVHSRTALQTIKERMPALRSFFLRLSYPPGPPVRRVPPPPGASLRLGLFGEVEPHKRVDQILAAMAELRRRGIDVRLDICGHAGVAMRELVDQIRALGLSSVVKLRGRLAHDEFFSEIAGVDLCVNLRDPTMGETSAIVTQAMQLGTPVIVSDVGWYAELPDFVLKVPAGPGAVDALVTHLARLDADRELLHSLAASTRRYASTDLGFDGVIECYVGILAELEDERKRRRQIDAALYRDVAVALGDIELTGSRQEAAIREHILGALSPCF